MRHRFLNAGLFLTMLLLGCGQHTIPKGPPCVFDTADVTPGWRRIELPGGTFAAPSDLPLKPTLISTFEGDNYSFSTPGLKVGVGGNSYSIVTTKDVLCSELRGDHWLVVWRHFEENRARDFGYHFWAYLLEPDSRRPDFGLKVWVEDQRRVADAERIASSIRLPDTIRSQ